MHNNGFLLSNIFFYRFYIICKDLYIFNYNLKKDKETDLYNVAGSDQYMNMRQSAVAAKKQNVNAAQMQAS